MNVRTIGLRVGGLVGAVIGAALLYDLAAQRLRDRREGNAAPDLAESEPHPGPEHRAPDAFHPDPTAPVPASELQGLRPALLNGGGAAG
jgi:hypothetical protein